MLNRFFSHIDGSVVFFGMLAVAAFWYGIQLCWSVSGKPWYSILARLTGALALIAFGVLMIFFTAFGAG